MALSNYRSNLEAKILAAFPFAVLGFAFWLPLFVWLLRSSPSTLSLATLLDAPFWPLVVRTFEFGLFVTLFSLGLAYPMAILWVFLGRRPKYFLYIIFLFPLLIGLLARNYSWIGLLSGTTVISSFGLSLLELQSFLYTAEIVIAVMTYIFTPIAFYILTYGLSSVKEEQIEAARVLGASGVQIIRRVLIPPSRGPALLAICLIFSSSIAYFVTPAMLGGGKYDFVGNLILIVANLGQFEEASDMGVRFIMIALPVYLISMFLVVRKRNLIIGR